MLMEPLLLETSSSKHLGLLLDRKLSLDRILTIIMSHSKPHKTNLLELERFGEKYKTFYRNLIIMERGDNALDKPFEILSALKR